MKKETAEFETRMNSLNERHSKLLSKNKEIALLIDSQNKSFDNLRKGYIALNLINDSDYIAFSPLLTDEFSLRLSKIQEMYEIDNNNSIKDKFLIQSITDNQIVELLDLIQIRWFTILGFLKLWSERRANLRLDIDQLLEAEYPLLLKCRDASLDSDWISKAESLFNKHDLILQEQEKLIQAEEGLYAELNSLINFRSSLFDLASRNFEI